MSANHLAQLLEAALFSASHPLTLNELRGLEPDVSPADVRKALEALREHYETDEHAFELVELAQGYQLLTRREHAEALTEARIAHRPRKLSAASLETLAIIAYREPVGRAEIEEIRGVAADGVLKHLQDRDLIDVAGRGEGLGRPLLYRTTDTFLAMMGLNELSELPRLDQLAVALRPLAEELPETEGEGEAVLAEEQPKDS